MDLDQINKTIDLIAYLISNTIWGQNTSSKNMLKLVYNECRELGMSLSNTDVENTIEEIADVNMMLAYFCCKLPGYKSDDVKDLFRNSAINGKRLSNNGVGTKNFYRMILINYGNLIHVFEESAGRDTQELYKEVGGIVASAITLACTVCPNDLNVISTIFEAISIKLKSRYPAFFRDLTEAPIFSEEKSWKIAKKREKDKPYIYCSNPKCTYCGKLYSGNIQIISEKATCQSCGTDVNQTSILLPQYSSEVRRIILEDFEKNLRNYCAGDRLVANLYVYRNPNNCIAIFSDLIYHHITLTEFVRFFSVKCAVKICQVKNFLRICFYGTYSFDVTTPQKLSRANAMRGYINNYSAELISLLIELDIGRKDAKKILYPTLSYLANKYPTKCCWNFSNENLYIDVKGKHTFFSILLIMNEIIQSKRIATNVIFQNANKNLSTKALEALISYFFIDDMNAFKRISFESGDSHD